MRTDITLLGVPLVLVEAVLGEPLSHLGDAVLQNEKLWRQSFVTISHSSIKLTMERSVYNNQISTRAICDFMK